MQTEIAETIYEKVKILSPDEQQKVLEIVEQKVSVSQKKDSRPIWEVIDERVGKLSAETIEKLPTDEAENHGYYLYGAPKKQK